MPRYYYQCAHCQIRDTRIAGLDDDLAVCHWCGQVMLRLDLDLFGPYFGEPAAAPGPQKKISRASGRPSAS